MSDYQLIVIGAGPGGYTAALRAAKLGLHTAIVERREVGGTCLNRGCIPTKTLLHASQVYYDAVNGAPVGVHSGAITYDIGEMFAFKRSVSEKLRGGIQALLKGVKVDVIEGTAQITAPGQVDVTGPDGTVTRYTADRILAATGSVNVRPPIPGLDLPGVMTSDELLEGTDTPYASIVIIGGGVIGVEFATFYSHLGCRVTLVEGMANLMPQLDRELGQNLAQILKKQGVEVLTSAMVQSLEQTVEGLCVHLNQKGKELTVTGEKVLCAIGRRAPAGGRKLPDQHPRCIRHRRCLRRCAAGPCGRRPGHGLRGADVRQPGQHRSECDPQLHLQRSGDRRGGSHRGRGQGAGDSRRVRQVHPLQQRPHHH